MFIEGGAVWGHVFCDAFWQAGLLAKEGSRCFRGLLATCQELGVAGAVFLFRVFGLLACRAGVVRRALFALRVFEDSVDFARDRRVVGIVSYLGGRAARNEVHRGIVNGRSEARVRACRFLRVFRLLIRKRFRVPRSNEGRLFAGRVVIVRDPSSFEFPPFNDEFNGVIWRDYPAGPGIVHFLASVVGCFRHVVGVVFVYPPVPYFCSLRHYRFKRGG